MKVKTLSCFVLAIGLCTVFIPACLHAGPLQYQGSSEVEAGLQNGKLAHDFNFYLSGSQAEPHTIIGVLKSISFNQSLWQPSDSTPKVLESWYKFIDNPHRAVWDQYFGGYIVTDSGQYIGVWFSKHRFLSAG